MNKEETISVRNIYNGSVVKLDVHKVKLENQKISEREIITHPGGVAAIPVTDSDEIYFVKQFRKAFEEETLEIPAGKREKNENPLDCAVRELKEETGITAERVTHLISMYPSPGYTDEVIHIYKAEGLTYGDKQTDEDEFIELYKCSLNEAVKMVKSGLIKDAKTIIAILMLENERLGQNQGRIIK